jgi:hypothetical protein
VIAALLVGAFGIGLSARQWAPAFMVRGDTPIEQTTPCGWNANVQIASMTMDREVARIYYLCWDGRQFVRELAPVYAVPSERFSQPAPAYQKHQ